MASVETFLVGVEDGAVDVRVDVGAGLVDDLRVVDEPPAQVPKALLQFVLQWASEDPHQPYCEQQFPHELPWQVYLLVPPHEPSGETAALAKLAESRPAVRE